MCKCDDAYNDAVECVTHCCDQPTPPPVAVGGTLVYCEDKELADETDVQIFPGQPLTAIDEVTHTIEVKAGDCVVVDMSGVYSVVGEGIASVYFELYADGSPITSEYEIDFVTANMDANTTLHAVWHPTEDKTVDIEVKWKCDAAPVHMSTFEKEGVMHRVLVFREMGMLLDEWLATKKFKGVAPVCVKACPPFEPGAPTD